MAVRVRPSRPAAGGTIVRFLAILTGSLLSAGCLSPSSSIPEGWDGSSLRLVSYGDSFTAGLGIAPERNWATGSAPGAQSVLQRLQATIPDAVGFNAAVSGARYEELPAQVEGSPAGASLVLILLGLNDVCVPEPRFDPARFQRDVREGLETVQAAHPGAHVYVFAVPDVTDFRRLHESVPQASKVWSGAWYCSDALDPSAPEASVRLAQERVESANRVLAQEADRIGFEFSAATVAPRFGVEEVSEDDFFHPNEAGARRLADLAWTSVAVADEALAGVP